MTDRTLTQTEIDALLYGEFDMTPKPPGYDEAVKEAMLLKYFADNGGNINVDVLRSARALLYAHEQRRTEGTHEVCNECKRKCDRWCGAADSVIDYDDCPIRRGGEG